MEKTIVRVPKNPIERGPTSSGTRYKLPKTVGPQLVNRVVPWVEGYYHEFGRYPSDSEFLTRYNIDAAFLRNIQGSKLYRRALSERGIRTPFPGTEQDLLPEQTATINVLTNFSDTRSTEAKLAGLGVTTEQLNGWFVDPEFKRRMALHADHVLENMYPEAMTSFHRQVSQGNMQAIRMYFEVTGRLASPEVVDIQRTLQAVIESVQRHVKDPTVLQAIAADLELTKILEGRA